VRCRNECVSQFEAAVAGALGAVVPSFGKPQLVNKIGEGGITELVVGSASGQISGSVGSAISGWAR